MRVLIVLLLFFVSCKPVKESVDQKRIEDSIKIERAIHKTIRAISAPRTV